MGFFDDLGRKVTDVGQKTVQKTKDMSDTARINSLISQSERQLTTLYNQIGERYVNVHRNDCEEEFKTMVDTVVELEQKISAFRQQILDIKGVRRCEKCGAEVQRGVAFCSACGAPLPKTAQTDNYDRNVAMCPNCGNPIEKGACFCTACGQAITISPVAEVQNNMPSKVQNDDVKTDNVSNICPQCGTKLTDGMAFCTECGYAVAVLDSGKIQNSEVPNHNQDEAIIQEETKRICPQCGAKLTADSLFCTECGIRF